MAPLPKATDLIDRLVEGPDHQRNIEAWRALALEAAAEIKRLRGAVMNLAIVHQPRSRFP
jgi:hypothetical protein